jgi:hypothetical protein
MIKVLPVSARATPMAPSISGMTPTFDMSLEAAVDEMFMVLTG